MSLNVCSGQIRMRELRGPHNEEATKTKEYCEFRCKECRLKCYRFRELNGLWNVWIPETEDDSQLEIIQESKYSFSHAQICKHEGYVSKPADYQTLIRDAINRRDLDNLKKTKTGGTPEKLPEKIYVVNSTTREFQHFSCMNCNMDCDRYRELGTFWNGGWQTIDTILL